MKYTNQLTIEFLSENPTPIVLTHNDLVIKICVNNRERVTLDLVADIQNNITIVQDRSANPGFIVINQVILGSLDITKIMYNVCELIDLGSGNKIGGFVPDIGYPDQMNITIPTWFYKTILNEIDFVDVVN